MSSSDGNLNKTKRYSRHTYGDDGDRGRRNVLSVSFVATDLKRPALASTTALAAATATSSGGSTTIPLTAQPDVPRNITITTGGTAGDIKAVAVVVTGTNVEGKVITESITTTVDTANTTVGNSAFKTVTSVSVPAQDGNGATYAVGYGSKLGIGMRNIASMPVKVLTRSSTGVEAMEDASASALSATLVEGNTVTTTTANDGAVGYRVYVLNYKWTANPTNGQPSYGV